METKYTLEVLIYFTTVMTFSYPFFVKYLEEMTEFEKIMYSETSSFSSFNNYALFFSFFPHMVGKKVMHLFQPYEGRN
jgi:hypothetical protein